MLFYFFDLPRLLDSTARTHVAFLLGASWQVQGVYAVNDLNLVAALIAINTAVLLEFHFQLLNLLPQVVYDVFVLADMDRN